MKEDINDTNNTNNDSNEHENLVKNYESFSKSELDNEYYRIGSIPNARTNVDCLKQMMALMEVYESKGFEMPNKNSKQPQSSSGGCMSIIILLIIATAAFILI